MISATPGLLAAMQTRSSLAGMFDLLPLAVLMLAMLVCGCLAVLG